ncbi:uL22m family ribosomal protein [endosymbiont GvMRE of Glomus versiforme]|uniref:uL22m family ribosomal protein n=1 Tax=endosymbiont GvMRE of Glomus versiforme TaxID=2039283 RepID=UPI000ED398F6|nr:uL22 family ribosomal protein [endosymbiont GvMRE of Glomus versiforme]RHZ35564.1 50S ribosomal protein L22 [endosymbiont GvMRE of Glomus versiforme]
MESIIIKSSQIAISPQKLNLVAEIVRSTKEKGLYHSLKILSFLPKKGGRILFKLLQGVTKSLEKQKIENVYLRKIEINQGKVQKNIMYRAKGRADKIRKRYSLVKLYLTYA